MYQYWTGPPLPLSRPDILESLMNQDHYKQVLRTIADHGSVSLYELMSLTDVPDAEVRQIVYVLKQEDLVRIKDTGTPDAMITIREKALAVA